MKRIIELAMLFVVAAVVAAMATGSRAADVPARAGDKVVFVAEKVNGALTVTRLEAGN